MEQRRNPFVDAVDVCNMPSVIVLSWQSPWAMRGVGSDVALPRKTRSAKPLFGSEKCAHSHNCADENDPEVKAEGQRVCVDEGGG